MSATSRKYGTPLRYELVTQDCVLFKGLTGRYLRGRIETIVKQYKKANLDTLKKSGEAGGMGRTEPARQQVHRPGEFLLFCPRFISAYMITTSYRMRGRRGAGKGEAMQIQRQRKTWMRVWCKVRAKSIIFCCSRFIIFLCTQLCERAASIGLSEEKVRLLLLLDMDR